MNNLINTLLDCPNLSLRLLDSSTGRTVKTINAEQLRQFVHGEHEVCSQDCDNSACPNRPEAEKL